MSYVADGEQTAVKEEEDAEDHEERAKGGEGDTDLWTKSAAGRGDRGGRALGVREPDHHCWRGTVVGRMKILLESTIDASSSSVAVAKTSRRVSCRVAKSLVALYSHGVEGAESRTRRVAAFQPRLLASASRLSLPRRSPAPSCRVLLPLPLSLDPRRTPVVPAPPVRVVHLLGKVVAPTLTRSLSLSHSYHLHAHSIAPDVRARPDLLPAEPLTEVLHILLLTDSHFLIEPRTDPRSTGFPPSTGLDGLLRWPQLEA